VPTARCACCKEEKGPRGEVAGACLLLASALASFVTGEIVAGNGGIFID